MKVEKEKKEAFLKKLEIIFKRKIDLKINNNKTVFLTAKKLLFKKMYLSIHRCFLNASDDVLQEVKSYLVYGRKKSLQEIRNYIENYYIKHVPKSFKTKKIESVGNVYDLNLIFHEINKIYFSDNLPYINTTWFKKPVYKKGRSFTLGSYDNIKNLIRINKILDDEKIPDFFVSFIMYHEMLHAFIPYYMGKDGKRKIHTKKFKENERKFLYYKQAKNFEKILIKERKFYGRT